MDWLSLSDVEARVNALESLMVEKGLAEHEAVDAVVASFENDMGPVNGAKVVVRAWTDPEYKKWLLADATAAIADMGFTGLQTEHMVAVENTAQRHNVVVCTLCSCYPWTLLGIPPAWFKYPQYRARVVKEPRSVLAEFGVTLADDVHIDVWDSSAEIRSTRSGCSPTRPRRSPTWGSPACRPSTWWRSRTPRSDTTSWCARCALVIRGRCWAFRRPGSNIPSTVPAS